VTNWHDYNNGLRQRGNFTIWFTEEAIVDWYPAKTGARGRPQKYSDIAIETTPVRRVEIPKPDGKGVRLLGIPTVRDRVVQTTLKLLLEPIFEAHFSPNSYGFRPGRSQHQAVQAAQQIINSGKPFVVDIDLSKFFDRIHHDRLIARMGQKIADKRLLRNRPIAA
jgi:RNA-directed DNA polymerase